jgi:serine/threonine-protein phosphatase 2B catalytic subunit
LKDSVLYESNDSKPDWRILRDFVYDEGELSKPQVIKLCKNVIEVLKKEPNLMRIKEPVVIVGDIHGQYYDLCHMLGKAGSPEHINYLFLGDYVDRGIYGLEVLLLLFAIKLNYPQRVIMLRGNHESRSMTENFTFRQEILDKYDAQVYELFLDVFNSLPLACIVEDKYLAMHGGISPDIVKIDDIN